MTSWTVVRVIGAGGNDVLIGGAGNDTLQGNSGDDTLSGGSGIDTVSYSGSNIGVAVSLAITTAQDFGGNIGTDTLIGIENLEGSGLDDTLKGNNQANLLQVNVATMAANDFIL